MSLEFFEIKLPYEKMESWEDGRLQAYRALLKEKIFPAIDDANKAGLLSSYHFLTHKDLELRSALKRREDVEALKKVLAARGLPTALEPWGFSRPAAEAEILRLTTEITRSLLALPDPGSIYYLVCHYQDNQFGMTPALNQDWLFRQAMAWQVQHLTIAEGLRPLPAATKAREALAQALQAAKPDFKLP